MVIAIGYDLIKYAPARWHLDRDKTILHIHRTPAEVDANFELAVGIQGSIPARSTHWWNASLSVRVSITL